MLIFSIPVLKHQLPLLPPLSRSFSPAKKNTTKVQAGIYEAIITIGPATVIASVNTPVPGFALARLTYVSPAKSCGTVQAPPVNGTNAVPPNCPAFVNAQNVAPVAVLDNARLWPAVKAAVALPAPAAMVTAGNPVIAKLDPVGHEEMKPAARVKTLRTPRGVSNGDGMAAALEATRMNVWWRASIVTIEAATLKIAGLFSSGAAPRYADTPTFSKIDAVATMLAASVSPKL